MMPCSNEIVHLISFILEICKGTCACCTVLFCFCFFLFIKEILIKSSWFLSLTRLPCYRIQLYMPAGLQSTVQTCVRQQRAIEAKWKWNLFPLHQPADRGHQVVKDLYCRQIHKFLDVHMLCFCFFYILPVDITAEDFQV